MSAFALNRRAADGHQNYCRVCTSEWAREHRPRKLALPPADVPEGQKWCRRCETVKSLDEFPGNVKRPDGRQTYCRACFAEIYRKKREAAGLIARPGNIPEGHKFCRGCQLIKPIQDFGADTRKTGPNFRCSDCSRQRDRQRYLGASYGLTVEAVEELLASQGGLCAICMSVQAVHVDHDHQTGKVRGMLCFRCNAALGQFDDRPEVLVRAARYLMAAAANSPSEVSRIEVTYTERLAALEFGSAS